MEAVGLYPFDATGEDELSFGKGAIIKVSLGLTRGKKICIIIWLITNDCVYISIEESVCL